MKTLASRVLLALVVSLLIYLLAFACMGCSNTEEITPEPVLCDSVTADFYAPQRVHLHIQSDLPEITFVWQKSGHTIVVEKPFYADLLLVLCLGDAITLNGECTIDAR